MRDHNALIRTTPVAPDDLGLTAAQWLAARPGAMTGLAEVFFLANGAPAPVRVTTHAFVWSEQPHSLDVMLHDPSETTPSFLMILGLSGDYIGPGEYKGGISDIAVGVGVVEPGGDAFTWTAAVTTASDLRTYGSGASATCATFTSTGLVAGPMFGPPAGDTPGCSVLFAWYELGGPG